ncbi:hypothetical protein [Streptomyces sp. NBC_01304]|uniref:hypothetical protein n=1 Tax=Streptomyces sp. NBC_01304 TaxID=2903818 RepID=UPI003FA3697D
MIYNAVMVTLPATVASLHTPVPAQAWLLNGTPLGLAAAPALIGVPATLLLRPRARHTAARPE